MCCKLDFRNAFNMVSRVAFLRYAARYFPTLLLFLLAAYGAPAYITALGPDGCRLGALLVTAGLHAGLPARAAVPCSWAAVGARATVHHGFPDVLLAALHDDVEIAGPPARVLLALQAMIATADVGAGLAAAHRA